MVVQCSNLFIPSLHLQCTDSASSLGPPIANVTHLIDDHHAMPCFPNSLAACQLSVYNLLRYDGQKSRCTRADVAQREKSLVLSSGHSKASPSSLENSLGPLGCAGWTSNMERAASAMCICSSECAWDSVHSCPFP